MGSVDFYTFARGDTAYKAFNDAVDDAHYYYGHAGYTGTIAEKQNSGFVMIPWLHRPNVQDENILRKAALEFASKLVSENDDRIDDKWGPAGCLKVKDELWLFFGWASQ